MARKHPSDRGMAGTLVKNWLPSYLPAFNDAHVLIASQTVGAGGAASVTFSSIPQTYKWLELRSMARGSGAGTGNVGLRLYVNGDSTNTQAYHILYGNGTSALASSSAPAAFLYLAEVADGGATANTFGVSVAQILDYSSATKNTVVRALGGVDLNGSGTVTFISSLRPTAAATTSVQVSINGSNLAQNSTFSLYGVL